MRSTYLQACCDCQILSRAESAADFQKLRAELPSVREVFSARLIAGAWAHFVTEDAFEKYADVFTLMPICEMMNCRETWHAWFTDFGWVAAVRMIADNMKDGHRIVTSHDCLQFLRHKLSQRPVDCPAVFLRASGNLMPWLGKGTIECRDAGNGRAPMYRVRFYFQICKNQAFKTSLWRKSRVTVEKDLASLHQAVSYLHLEELLRNLPRDRDRPFTTDLIASNWTGFAIHAGFERYADEFSSMPVHGPGACRETWSVWFAEFGWVGAVHALAATERIASSECLQFLRYVLTDAGVDCPASFNQASRALMPWLETGTLEYLRRKRFAQRRYRAHFTYQMNGLHFHERGPQRKSINEAARDRETLCDATSVLHLREMRTRLPMFY